MSAMKLGSSDTVHGIAVEMPPVHRDATAIAVFKVRKGNIVVNLAWDKKVTDSSAEDNWGRCTLTPDQALQTIEQLSRCLRALGSASSSSKGTNSSEKAK